MVEYSRALPSQFNPDEFVIRSQEIERKKRNLGRITLISMLSSIVVGGSVVTYSNFKAYPDLPANLSAANQKVAQIAQETQFINGLELISQRTPEQLPLEEGKHLKDLALEDISRLKAEESELRNSQEVKDYYSNQLFYRLTAVGGILIIGLGTSGTTMYNSIRGQKLSRARFSGTLK